MKELSIDTNQYENPAIDRKHKILIDEAEIAETISLKVVKDQFSNIVPSEDLEIKEVGIKIKNFLDEVLHKIKELEQQAISSALEEKKIKMREAMIRQKNRKKGARIFDEEELKTFEDIAEGFEKNRLSVPNINVRVRVTAPIGKLFEKLRMKGFIRPCKNLAQVRKDWALLADREIIKSYNTIMRGILNYYRGADNLYNVKGIINLIRRSCAMTLAHKHKKNIF